MEKEGLVRKVNDLDRRNLISVAITEKGEAVYQRSRDSNVIHEILSSLSQEQQDNLRPCLETLRNRAVEELRPRR